MPPARKCESDYDKRKKRKQITELINSQKGAHEKFVVKEHQIPAENQHVDCENVDNEDPNVDVQDDDVLIENTDDDDVPIGEDYVNNIENVNINPSNDKDDVEDQHNENVKQASILPDIFDPRTWDGLDAKMIDLLAEKGPRRDPSIVKGPKDKFSRRFTANLYTRVLSNGEKCDREWLVYSNELDKLFCFCCKLFRIGTMSRGPLANEGFGDWAQVIVRLREHETSMEHFKNMTTWHGFRRRLQNNQTIDKEAQRLIEKEKDHWKKVLQRVISVVKFLGKNNLAFCGSDERLYQKSNDNFLGLIEMLAKFDPVIQEYVGQITDDNIHFHYFGHSLQNELIFLLASAISNEIIKKIKKAKYFSVILDCTPDVSHQEQMTLILRYVDVSSSYVEESFLRFLIVDDTSGQGLFNVLEEELKKLDLDILDVRGQSYDNWSNMKGKNQGVQKKLLDINPRAFYTPCGCHSLNLVVCDMARTCGKVGVVFGIIQRIYTIFAHSTKRWDILKDNLKGLTPKLSSSTRWESRLDSVKAIKLKMPEIREALLQVADVDNDNKIRSGAESLANNELDKFEFILAIVIWYDILNEINMVSKFLKSNDMLIDVAIKKIKGLISFFEGYGENGFDDAMKNAKVIALEMDVDPMFPQRREIRRKKHFDESPDKSSTSLSAEESFRIQYFVYIVDQVIVCLNERLEQYEKYEKTFGFMFTSDNLQSLDDLSLKSCCAHLESALAHNEHSDIDGDELFVELKLLREMLPTRKMRPNDILKFLRCLDCFPNAIIAYRILLTIPITGASAERGFSKSKLLKSYLHSTMLQEKSNELALLAIENELLDEAKYEDLIDDFASKSVKKLALFK